MISSEGYDELADCYEDILPSPTEDLSFWRSLAASAHSLCEVGCGNGRVLQQLWPTNKVVGVDPSKRMIVEAKKAMHDRPPGSGPKPELRVGGLPSIPAANNEFDLVIAPRGSVSHVTGCDLQDISRELARITRRRGIIVLDLPQIAANDPRRVDKVGPVVVKQATRSGLHFTIYAEYWFLEEESELGTTYTLVWETADRDRASVQTVQLRTRMYDLQHLLACLENAGIAVEYAHGDYSGAPVDPNSPRLIVRGQKC